VDNLSAGPRTGELAAYAWLEAVEAAEATS
jgi:hypothetical protein